MVHYKNGDLLSSNENIYAHQTNCMGVMGRGIALQIKRKYKEVYNKYKLYCWYGNSVENNPFIDNNHLGKAQFVHTHDGHIVANLFGQYDYRWTNETRPLFLKLALIELKEYARANNYSIGLPYKIGCGLGGGDWEQIEQIIQEVFNDYDVTIYKYDEA